MRPPWKLKLAVVLIAGAVTAAVCEEMKLPPLTSVSGNPRLPGKFVWADLVTDDVQKVRPFYKELFGWTFLDYGNYAIASNDERPLCGMFQRPRPADRPDAKPRWFAYMSVKDVSKAQAAVMKAGGRVLAPRRKMPDRGEQAVFADPEGVLFGAVKSMSGDPEDFLADPGDWIWIELLSKDARKAGEFYRAIAGYEVVENAASPRPADYVFTSAGYARAAALTIPADKQEMKPKWLLFVRVKSVSECVAQTEKLGGKALIPPRHELLDGKVAVLTDPAGAEIGVMEWSGNPAKAKD